MVGNGEPAAPSLRSDRPGKSRKQRLRISIGDRQHWNFRDGGGLFDLQPLGVLGGADARRERISRIIRHIGDAAALHTIRRTVGSFGKGLTGHEAIFVRIGVDETTNRAMLGRHFGLDAAPGVVIASDDNLTLHRNTQTLELLVVFGNSIVHVDEGSGHVAVNRVSVIRGKLLGLLIRCEILQKRRLLELRSESWPAFHEFYDALLRRWEEHVKLLDVRIETEFFEFHGDPFGVVFVVG